jgi:hypothetical protein
MFIEWPRYEIISGTGGIAALDGDVWLVSRPGHITAHPVFVGYWRPQSLHVLKLKTKLHGLSPRANYTDWATAPCRRRDCQLFADRGCHVVGVADPYGRILDFLDRSRYFFYQVAPQLNSRGWVDPVPDTLLFFSGSAGNRTRASGSVAKKSDR